MTVALIGDTGNNTVDARELLNDIKRVTDQPVGYVVMTQTTAIGSQDGGPA